jgi:hypothetical protein
MENILAVIVIIIIAALSLIGEIRKKQRAKKGARPAGRGWVQRLDAFLTDIQNRLEQRSKESATGAFDWNRLRGGGDGTRSRSDAQEAVTGELVFEETEPPPPLPKKQPLAVSARTQTVRSDETPSVPDAPQPMALHTGKPSYAATAVSRADLRKAVIWSEILGPPVALRNQLNDRR